MRTKDELLAQLADIQQRLEADPNSWSLVYAKVAAEEELSWIATQEIAARLPDLVKTKGEALIAEQTELIDTYLKGNKNPGVAARLNEIKLEISMLPLEAERQREELEKEKRAARVRQIDAERDGLSDAERNVAECEVRMRAAWQTLIEDDEARKQAYADLAAKQERIAVLEKSLGNPEPTNQRDNDELRHSRDQLLKGALALLLCAEAISTLIDQIANVPTLPFIVRLRKQFGGHAKHLDYYISLKTSALLSARYAHEIAEALIGAKHSLDLVLCRGSLLVGIPMLPFGYRDALIDEGVACDLLDEIDKVIGG